MTLTTINIKDTAFIDFFCNFLSILSYFTDTIKNKVEKTLKIISDNNAIIAGGALTNVLLPNPIPINDIDVYVNLKNSQKLINSLLIDSNMLISSLTQPVYDRSFMLHNNILAKVSIEYKYTKLFDIMIVKDDISLEQVVDNFDLTFCKVWSDGKKIYTHYMDDIKNLNGKLDAKYLKDYLEGNDFTYKRLRKYSKKGFSIDLPNIDTSDVVFKKHKKNVVSPKEWVGYYILNNLKKIIFNDMIYNNFYISFDVYALQKLSSINADKIYDLESVMTIIKNIYEPSFDDKFNLNTAVYGLIMYGTNNTEICDWDDKKILKYFEKYGIKILPDSTGPSHGFNNEPWDFCGENPYIHDKLRDINTYNLYELFRKEYEDISIIAKKIPERRLTATEQFAQQQQRMIQAAQRFADPNEENQEEEQAVGMYTTPGGKEVPARCFNMTEGGNINTSSWANEEGSILLLVESSPGLDPDLVCTNINELEYALRENTGIIYRCGGTRGNRAGDSTMVDDVSTLGDVPYDLSMANVDKSIEYIPFVYDLDVNTAVKGYLPKKEMQNILSIARGNNDFPVLSLSFVDTISHTASKDVLHGGSMIGANHCQSGSTVAIFKLEDIEIENSECSLTFEVDILEREGDNIERPPPTEFMSGDEAADFILHWIDNNVDESINNIEVYFGNGTEAPFSITREFINIFSHLNQPLETFLSTLLEHACTVYKDNKDMFLANADNNKVFWLDIYLIHYQNTIRVNLYNI